MADHLSKRKAIRAAFHRLGMQASPGEVVADLAARGIMVTEEFVRQIRCEIHKEDGVSTIRRSQRPVTSRKLRRQPSRRPRGR